MNEQELREKKQRFALFILVALTFLLSGGRAAYVLIRGTPHCYGSGGCVPKPDYIPGKKFQ